MGNWLRILSVFALLLSVVVAGQVKAQEDNTDDDLPPQGNIVVVDSAFVRGGPSDEFIAVGALFEGDEVTPLNISEDGLWILIPYSRGNGWIQRNLVRWEDNDALDLLPVLPANITPTPRIAVTNTPFIPTNTPVGNYINLEGAASAYVRAGPGRTYLRLGQLLPGDSVEPVGRNDDTTWIMIRFLNEPLNDGFGWIAVELVYWEDYNSLQSLPVVDSDNLTPTITFTPSATASSTNTPTHTATITETSVSTLTASATNSDFPTSTNTAIPTSEPTDTATSTDLPTNTATATDEPTNTATATLVPTSTDTTTPTNTATATTEPTQTNTATSVPTNTPTITATSTDLPTNTATWTVEPSATNTDVPTATATATVTETPTDEPTATLVPTSTDTEQATEIIEAVVVASDTVTPTSTLSSTPTPTITNTPTVEMTDIFAVQGTSVAIEATNQALGVSPEPTQTLDSVQESSTQDNSGSISVEGVVAVALLFVVVTYSWFYLQGLAASGRYADGFVIHKCPVCGRGNLHLDTKQSRIVGIPIVRRIVRCDECRSVLRETGSQRWRYAVDRIENPSLYARFNGHEISDSDLERLAKSSSQLASTDANTQLMVDDLES